MNRTTVKIKEENVEHMILFLQEAARYFENRGTGGEDSAYWANVYNSENCRNIAAFLKEMNVSKPDR